MLTAHVKSMHQNHAWLPFPFKHWNLKSQSPGLTAPVAKKHKSCQHTLQEESRIHSQTLDFSMASLTLQCFHNMFEGTYFILPFLLPSCLSPRAWKPHPPTLLSLWKIISSLLLGARFHYLLKGMSPHICWSCGKATLIYTGRLSCSTSYFPSLLSTAGDNF